MKFLGGALVLSIVLLSLFQGEGHFVKPWHFCKTKEATDPPTPCTPLECSGLCGSLYTGGLGICIADVCQCLHSCMKEGPPKHTKPTVDTNRLSSSSSSSKNLEPDHNSNMQASSSSSSKDLRKPDRFAKVALSSSSSKDRLKPERISKVALSSSMPINKTDHISKASVRS